MRNINLNRFVIVFFWIWAISLYTCHAQATLFCQSLFKADTSQNKAYFADLIANKKLKLLGQGETTRIYSLHDGWAIRWPKLGKEQSIEFMEGFIDLQEELKEVGIRVVEIDHERTRSPDFIIVKEEKFLFNGDEFFSKINKPEKLGLSPAERNDIYIKFLEFVDKTWMYESISDVTPRQIGYNGSEWVLFDFYGSHSLPFHKPLLSIKSKNHVFESTEVAISSFEKSTVHWLPKKIEEEVKERISKIRKNQKKLKFFTRRETRMNRSLLIRKTVELLIPDHTKLEFNPLGIIKKTDFFGLGILAQVEIEIKSSIYINNKVSIYQAAFNGRSGRLFLLNRFESGDREKAQKYFNKQLNDTDHYVMSEDFIFVFDRS